MGHADAFRARREAISPKEAQPDTPNTQREDRARTLSHSQGLPLRKSHENVSQQNKTETKKGAAPGSQKQTPTQGKDKINTPSIQTPEISGK